MRISRVRIVNFANFAELDIATSESIVVVGENKVGKSSFIRALQLILDPGLSERDRQLGLEHFWDGLGDEKLGSIIEVAVELTDFTDDPRIMAHLNDCVVIPGPPMVARLTYRFEPKANFGRAPESLADYEYIIFGGADPDMGIGPLLRRNAMELDRLVTEGERDHTFFAVEEPEAHLHPHVQRLVYRYFLETKAAADDGERAGSLTTILTTHSPHIASVSPIRSIVLLRHDAAKGATIAVSTANTPLTSISPRRGPSRRSPASGWGVAAQRATHGARLPGRAGQLFRVRLMDGSDGIRLQSRRTRLWIRLGHGVPRAWQSRCSSPLQWTSGIRAEVAAVMTGKVSRYRASLNKERFLRSFTTTLGRKIYTPFDVGSARMAFGIGIRAPIPAALSYSRRWKSESPERSRRPST